MSRNLQRQMNMLDIPTGDLGAFKREGGKIKLYDSGSPKTPEKTTQTIDLPEWAKPYAKDALERGRALSNTPYQAYTGDRIAGFSPLQEQAQKSAAGLDAGPEAFSKGVGQYMSPYVEQALNPQIREATRASQLATQQQQAGAVGRGAFGGSRDALMRMEGERNLGQQLGDIRGRGYQAAYDSAANQFRQGIGQQQGIIGMQSQLGGQQQALRQQGLTQAYQDFMAEKQAPYTQLGYYSDMIRGLPLGQQSSKSVYEAPGNTFGQVAGLGMGMYNMYNQFNPVKGAAEGGLMQSYALGGSVTSQSNKESIVEDMDSIEQLQRAKEFALNRRDLDTVQAIDERIAQLTAIQAQSASLQNGLGSAFDNLPTEQQENVMSAANGGIIAFADEGAVDLEKIQREKDRASLGKAYEDFKTGARKTGAAAMDIGTMPFRGIAGAAESVVTRPLRALGLDIPYLPESFYGGDAASMTPYMDKIRREEGVAPTSKTANRPQPKGAGARSTPIQIAPDAPAPKVKEKQQRVSPVVDKAITKMAEQQGVPKEDFMDMYRKVRGELQTESKEDLKGLQDLIDKQSGKSKEIKEQAFRKALSEYGFAWAAKAAEPGASFVGSAAKASPALSASMAESEKLAAAADETDIKMQIEMRKFNIASRKNDSATAMSAAQNMRILQQQQETIKQQQAQLAETSRHNRAVEGLTGARIGASGNAYNTALLRTKSNLAVNAQKQAAKDWSDPLKGRELKTQYPSQKSYEKSLFNDMWSNAMPQLELIGTKSAEE
jgi:hypothetical protein